MRQTPQVRLNQVNLGAAITRNLLLEEASAQYIVFWDDDVEPADTCLDEYVAAMRAHPDAAAFAGDRAADSSAVLCVMSAPVTSATASVW